MSAAICREHSHHPSDLRRELSPWVWDPRLRSGRALGPAALDLLRVDIDELELLAMHPLDVIDGRVVRGHVV